MKNCPTIVEKIAKHLRHEISHSNLKSGEHLKESAIAKIFEISRVPVREAFRLLQSEGYLEVIPNRGSFVGKIRKKHILETSLVYELLAPVLLDAAIPKYNQKTYIKAGKILTQVEKCKDSNEVGYLLWDFAKVIFGPSKMPFIIGLFDNMYRQNIRMLNEIFEIAQHSKYDTSNHRKFLQLCKANRKEEAIELWSVHVKTIEQISLKTGLSKKN